MENFEDISLENKREEEVILKIKKEPVSLLKNTKFENIPEYSNNQVQSVSIIEKLTKVDLEQNDINDTYVSDVISTDIEKY